MSRLGRYLTGGDMRYAPILIVLLLGGCLEAFDLVEEKLGSPRYCHTPTGTVLCEQHQSPSAGR